MVRRQMKNNLFINLPISPTFFSRTVTVNLCCCGINIYFRLVRTLRFNMLILFTFKYLRNSKTRYPSMLKMEGTAASMLRRWTCINILHCQISRGTRLIWKKGTACTFHPSNREVQHFSLKVWQYSIHHLYSYQYIEFLQEMLNLKSL